MSIFCIKKLAPCVRLGEKFRQKRADLQLDIETVAARTNIQKKYLLAIEEGLYRILPKAKTYRLAYVRQYAEAVGLDAKEAVQQFSHEDGLEDLTQVHPHRSIKIFPFASISIFFRNSVLIASVVLFMSYLGWQVHGILQPPRLMVYAPVEGYVLSHPAALVQGETDKETRLTVNGQDIMVNEAGQFEAKIDLATGVNTIVITATKKHGKTTSITRHLVVKPGQKDERVSLK